ncbi:MAG: nucleotidyl transferase AbiEii/AbiGii toxin family protein [Cyanobium sp.]
MRPTVRLEFGAHSTGEPHGPMPVTCEAATHLAMLDFLAARPLVMDARRTVLEKAAAIHVACRKGRWGSGEGDRYSRHWYDLDRLAGAGIAEEAIRDRALAMEVAQHKEDFWRATDADEQPIDHLRPLSEIQAWTRHCRIDAARFAFTAGLPDREPSPASCAVPVPVPDARAHRR